MGSHSLINHSIHSVVVTLLLCLNRTINGFALSNISQKISNLLWICGAENWFRFCVVIRNKFPPTCEQLTKSIASHYRSNFERLIIGENIMTIYFDFDFSGFSHMFFKNIFILFHSSGLHQAPHVKIGIFWFQLWLLEEELIKYVNAEEFLNASEIANHINRYTNIFNKTLNCTEYIPNNIHRIIENKKKQNREATLAFLMCSKRPKQQRFFHDPITNFFSNTNHIGPIHLRIAMYMPFPKCSIQLEFEQKQQNGNISKQIYLQEQEEIKRKEIEKSRIEFAKRQIQLKKKEISRQKKIREKKARLKQGGLIVGDRIETRYGQGRIIQYIGYFRGTFRFSIRYDKGDAEINVPLYRIRSI